MTFFVFKPHVEGPTGAITTPDVLIDRLFVGAGSGLAPAPVNHLSGELAVQAGEGTVTMTPAYVLTALGGGMLIGPAATLAAGGISGAMAQVILARKAWRLANLLDHAGTVTVSNGTASQALDGSATPAELTLPLVDDRGNLPRGMMVLCPMTSLSVEVTAPARFAMALADPTLSRHLSHTVDLEPASADRWQSRPQPRYTVGPQTKDIEHYI